MALELKFIDKKKRLRNRFLEFAILTPIGFFFLLCFYTGRGGSVYDETFMEQFFNFEPYWRTIGSIGAPLMLIAYFSLDHLLKFQKGHINLGMDSVKLDLASGAQVFQFDSMNEIKVIKDLTYFGDGRNSSKVASGIAFKYSGVLHEYEFQINSKEEQNELNELIDHWKTLKPDLKVGYKQPFSIFNFR